MIQCRVSLSLQKILEIFGRWNDFGGCSLGVFKNERCKNTTLTISGDAYEL